MSEMLNFSVGKITQSSIDEMLAQIATFGDDEGQPLCVVEYFDHGKSTDLDGEEFDLKGWDVSFSDESRDCETIEEVYSCVKECLDTLKAIPTWIIKYCRENGCNPLTQDFDPESHAVMDLMDEGLTPSKANQRRASELAENYRRTFDAIREQYSK